MGELLRDCVALISGRGEALGVAMATSILERYVQLDPVARGRILEALRKQFGASEAAIEAWCGTWISDGFDALEALLKADANRSTFCFGSSPTLADVYLIPQVESARRFKVDMTRWPLISAVDAACAQLDAFRLAAPALQPDAA
jgi:maleylpyruvate isomerase